MKYFAICIIILAVAITYAGVTEDGVKAPEPAATNADLNGNDITNVKDITASGDISAGTSMTLAGDTRTSWPTSAAFCNRGFLATNSADQTLTANTYVKMSNLVEDQDTEEAFASSEFTVPVGMSNWNFHLNYQIDDVEPGESATSRIMVTSADQSITNQYIERRVSDVIALVLFGQQTRKVVNMEAGQKVWVEIRYTGSGGNQNLKASGDTPGFSGSFLGNNP